MGKRNGDNPAINTILRSIHNSWKKLDRNMGRYFLDNLRVSGAVDVQVDGLHFMMYAQNDDGIVDQLYFKGRTYGEMPEICLFKSLADHAQTVIDIGANTGLYSIVAKLSNPEVDVVAFEPYHVNCDRFAVNVALNELDNKITLVESALGASDGSVEFAVPESEQICDVLSADTSFTEKFTTQDRPFTRTTVPLTTLDAYVDNHHLQNVDLIKLDVENYELDVFKGAAKTLSHFSPVVLAEIFVTPERVAFYEEVLHPMGYQCYAIMEKGLFRTAGLIENSDCRNFLFSKEIIASQYISFADMDSLAKILMR